MGEEEQVVAVVTDQVAPFGAVAALGLGFGMVSMLYSVCYNVPCILKWLFYGVYCLRIVLLIVCLDLLL